MEAARAIEPPPITNENIGIHAVADVFGIKKKQLMDVDFLMLALRKSLEQASFTIMGEKSLKFPGKDSGATGFFILSESHAAFHTYPEFSYLAIDIFSCGTANPRNAISYFAKVSNADDYKLTVIDRGCNVRF